MITRIKTESRDEWKQLRKGYIGGSDAAAVVGMNPFCSAWSLWAEKVGAAPEFEGNLATEVGTFLEEFVAKKFEAETGKTVRRCNLSLVNDKYPWAIANIDRDVVGEDAGLEIKTTSELNTRRFKNGEYPGNYYCQCVHYLAVTGKARWYLAVLIGNREFKIFTIERDEDEIKALMEAEEDFWYGHVLTHTPPEADGSKATTEAVKTVFSEAVEEEADIREADAWLQNYMDLGEQIAALETEREKNANRVKALLGSRAFGKGSKFYVSWKSATRNSFDAKRFQAKNPGLDLSGYYKTSSYRTFKVAERKA